MKCPLLKDGALNIDYLNDNDKVQYSINTEIINNPVLSQYIDGGKLKVYPFSFCSSEIKSQDVVDQIEASSFYEKLESWIEENNKNHVLPEIDGSQYITVLSPGYMFNEEQTSATYQIQLQLVYYEGY